MVNLPRKIYVHRHSLCHRDLTVNPKLQGIRKAVIQFVSGHYGEKGRVPGLREIYRDEMVVKAAGGKCYPQKLELAFPHGLDGSGVLMKRICEASGVPPPTGRIRRSEKAKRERSRKADKQKESLLEELRRSYEEENRQKTYRKGKAEEVAEQVIMLATDPTEEISGPVLDALGEVLPKILERRYGFSEADFNLVSTRKCWPELLKFLEHFGVCETGIDICEWSTLSPEEKETFRELCMVDGEAGPLVGRISQLLTVGSEWFKLPENMRKLVVAIYNYSKVMGYTIEDTLKWMKDIKFYKNHYKSPEN